MKLLQPRERVVWTAVTAVLLAALAFFALSPRILAGTSDDETQAYLSTIGDTFRYIRDNYVDQEKALPKALYEGALKGMFESLGDPNSAYHTAKEWSRVTDTTTGSFGGVGLVISTEKGVGARVDSAIEGTPAYRAGLTAGDLILKIDGKPMADVELNDVVAQLRGAPQSTVTVTVRRGEAAQFDAVMTREVIEVPTVKYAMMPGGIGYLRITQFTAQTAERTRAALRFFDDAGYSSLIVDLRQNPGGLLTAAVDVANLFIDQGLIVERKNNRVASENVRYSARHNRQMVPPTIPIAVLVDGGSASASEILSGALRDYHRASLFGTRTYGKGSVQTVQALGDGGFRLTTSRYYTPSGICVDKVGLQPDIEVKEPDLNEAEQKTLGDLLNGNSLKDFVRANPQPTEAQVADFVSGLHANGVALSDRYLRRLVRNEVNRTNNNPPKYDLDFDIVLQAAVKALEGHQIATGSAQ